MKIAIAKWLSENLLLFILSNTKQDKTIVITYYYKDCDVHTINTGMHQDHYAWVRDMMSIMPLNPCNNWDRWEVTLK